MVLYLWLKEKTFWEIKLSLGHFSSKYLFIRNMPEFLFVALKRKKIITHGAVKTFVHLPNHHHNHQLVGSKERAITKIKIIRKHVLAKDKKSDQYYFLFL